MNPLAWLISLALPACGFAGAQGLPVPGVMDVAAIVRPATPNTALAAPAGFTPAPDIVTPPYHVPAAALFAAVQAVAAEQPRTVQAALYADRLQAHFVARSLVFNFPDMITVQVRPESDGGSDLILWSRSLYGESDLGVNRKRITSWLAALRAKLPPASEK
jgi:uncharacterized protein (DUF1499 family)